MRMRICPPCSGPGRLPLGVQELQEERLVS